jgi:hypothetical protein
MNHVCVISAVHIFSVKTKSYRDYSMHVNSLEMYYFNSCRTPSTTLCEPMTHSVGG